MIELELNRPPLRESYLDNLSLSAQITSPTNGLLHKDTTYAIATPGTYAAAVPSKDCSISRFRYGIPQW